MEKRSSRLTVGMQPQKGKALVLLRTLNDLLRRASKTGNTTTFCGRILTFLSTAFPLGDRSGVNFRGDYGPQWEPVTFRKDIAEEKMQVDEATSPRVAENEDAEMKTEDKEGESKDNTDDKPAKVPEKTEEEKKEGIQYFLARVFCG